MSDSQEENDDSGSDDDDDEASDSDCVPDSAGTTKPGARGAGAALLRPGAQGGGAGAAKRGGTKGSARKLGTAATQRQSFSEYVAQRRKSSGEEGSCTTISTLCRGKALSLMMSVCQGCSLVSVGQFHAT